MEGSSILVIEALVMPPGPMLLLTAAGLLLLTRRPWLARAMIVVALAGGLLLSMEKVSGLLMRQIEIYPALDSAALDGYQAQAIVVLSASLDFDAPEYRDDTVSGYSLVRARYAAYLHRLTGLPVLASGGWSQGADKSLAAVVADSLMRDFGVDTVWLEDGSRNTHENAVFSSRLLAEQQVERVFLVSHAGHLRRAVERFRAAGVDVIPAPTIFQGDRKFGLDSWLPSAHAMSQSRHALHEIVGSLWYAIRY